MCGGNEGQWNKSKKDKEIKERKEGKIFLKGGERTEPKLRTQKWIEDVFKHSLKGW